MSDQQAATEPGWSDEPDYPHRIENHVKVYLHLEETSVAPTIADQGTAPAGTRVYRRAPDGQAQYGTVTGWTTDGSALFVSFDHSGTYAGPTFRSIYLEHDPASTYRWAVSSVTVDGFPLDGTDDGHYCDYEGHPAGARPDWDRQHAAAAEVPLPTTDELLPLLARALGHQVPRIDSAQLRDAADLIADHAAWRADRDQLSSAEAANDAPSSSAWHDSDDTGCELADRAVALLTAMTAYTPTTPAPPGGPSGVALMRSALTAPKTPTNPANGTTAPPAKGPTP